MSKAEFKGSLAGHTIAVKLATGLERRIGYRFESIQVKVSSGGSIELLMTEFKQSGWWRRTNVTSGPVRIFLPPLDLNTGEWAIEYYGGGTDQFERWLKKVIIDAGIRTVPNFTSAFSPSFRPANGMSWVGFRWAIEARKSVEAPTACSNYSVPKSLSSVATR